MPQYDKPSNDEVKRILDEAIVLLRSTQGYENMLAAAMLSQRRDIAASVDLLNALGGEDTTDPLVLWTGLTMCESGNIGCDYARAETNVRTNHSSNTAFWIALAGNELKHGNEDDAAAKINAALSAPGFDGYFAERYLLLDRALLASTNWSAAERAMQILKLDVSRPPGFPAILSQCEKTDDAAWAQLCDQLVSKLQDADEMTARVYAYELQMRLLEARKEPEKAAALRERSVPAIIGVEGDESLLTATANVLLNDEVLLGRFLQDVESLGEISAFRRLTEEVSSLQSSDRYDKCQFIANPYLDI